MDIGPSVRYVCIYLSVYTVDVHVLSDRYKFIFVYMLVRVMNIYWVGTRQFELTGSVSRPLARISLRETLLGILVFWYGLWVVSVACPSG